MRQLKTNNPLLSPSLRELLAILTGAVTIYVLAARFDLLEHFLEVSRQYEAWEIDEIATTLIYLAFAFSLFSWRRWRELKEEIKFRERIEARLNANLKEKEILLKEVNHRVKNNLTIVSSLLRMQARGIADAHARSALNTSEDRVAAMSLIHQKLYQSESLTDVNFKDYVNDLCHSLIKAYQLEPGRIELRMHIDDINLEIGQGVACGLMLNELISNALEHAFPNNRHGAIEINLTVDHDRCHMKVRDDGVGISREAKSEKPASLGLELVTILTEQIHGQLTQTVDNGTCFEISFPLAGSQPEGG